MSERPLYTKTFSRSRSLINFEIWYWGEAAGPRRWTDKEQPFKPYIVFNRVGEIADVYYDQRGIEWCKSGILERLNADPESVKIDAKKYQAHVEKYGDVIEKMPALALPEFINFVEDARTAYPYFELAWWAVEALEEKGGSQDDIDYFLNIRRNTEKAWAAYHYVIERSLAAAYPEAAGFADVIAYDEAKNGKIPSTDVLTERQKGYFYTNATLFVGKAETDIENMFKIQLESTHDGAASEIRGQVAFKGKVRGRVRKIFTTAQIKDFLEGEILVAPVTEPDYLPAIRKAAALVADEGGIVSHTAIVSRELKKPCIIGTKFATQYLNDGDLVEVDADNGVVRKL